MEKYLKYLKNFALKNAFNFRAWVVIIAVALAATLFANFARVKVNELSDQKVIEEVSLYEFPDQALVDPYKNPVLYDTYRGTFGAHFNTAYLRSSDYKLLVLNEDSSYYMFDSYYTVDNIYGGTIGSGLNIVKTAPDEQRALESFKHERAADEIEKVGDWTLYAYVLKPNEDFNVKESSIANGRVVLKTYSGDLKVNAINDFTDHFGYPVNWVKAAVPPEWWEDDIDDPFWDTYNKEQTIIVPYENADGFDENDFKTYTEVTILGVNEFYVRGDLYKSPDALERFLRANGYMTIEDAMSFTMELYADYYMDPFN